jgi:hypothetical protein
MKPMSSFEESAKAFSKLVVLLQPPHSHITIFDFVRYSRNPE